MKSVALSPAPSERGEHVERRHRELAEREMLAISAASAAAASPASTPSERTSTRSDSSPRRSGQPLHSATSRRRRTSQMKNGRAEQRR